MVVMGRVTAPFGIKGWVKIYALTAEIGSLCDYPVWWVGREGDWREMRVTEAKVHGKLLVGRLAGVDDCDAAAALRGMDIAVPREQLPRAGADEFYWADLIGLGVVNVEGHDFGHVTRIVQTGANDVLEVTQGEVSTLIPFIADVIRKVDIAGGVMTSN